MESIRAYLTNGTLLADAKEAEKVKKRSNWFILYEGILYKQSFARPLLWCVTPWMESEYWKNCIKAFAVRMREAVH